MLWWITIGVVFIVLGIGLWLFARRSSSIDEDLRYMNEGQITGPGIFGVIRRLKQ